MKENNLNTLFQNFLDKKLTSAELETLRQKLRKEPETKKLFTSFLLNNLKTIDNSLTADREMITEVYTNMQPVEMKVPNKMYLFQRYTSQNWPKLAIAASLLLLIVYSFLIYNSGANISGKNLYSLMIEPVSMERASATEMQLIERASFFYFKPTPFIDSLEALVRNCDSFCISQYYLAHAYLKTGQFGKAAPLFEDCIRHLDFLNQIPQLQGYTNEIKFNYLISKAMINNKDINVLNGLDTLIKVLNQSDPLYNKAIKFRNSL